MFYGCMYFNQPIGNWDVSKVENMCQMFSGAYSFNQPIHMWNISNLRNARYFMQMLGPPCFTCRYGYGPMQFSSFNQPVQPLYNQSKIGPSSFETSLGNFSFMEFIGGWCSDGGEDYIKEEKMLMLLIAMENETNTYSIFCFAYIML